MKILLGLLVAWSLIARPLEDLERKYGNPSSQTYPIRPGVGVTIRRDRNGAVAEMLIVPLETDSLVQSRHMTLGERDAKSVLEELVPRSSRGKLIIGTFLNVTCLPEDDCQGVSEKYENVMITFNSAKTPGQFRYVDVNFKISRSGAGH